MKPGSLLVNIARGAVVDEDAVADALGEGRLGGAALDVFEREPLSRWSRLWKTANLIVTPHVAGFTNTWREDVGDLICDNVASFVANRPFIGVVDRHRT